MMMPRDSATDYIRHGQDAAAAVMETAQDYTDTLTGHISRNPLTAVLIALGVGWLIGAMKNWY
jgi:hypothetical protein